MERGFQFEYFPDYLKWAQFASEGCHCEDGAPCLEGVYFGDPDIDGPVCIGSLADGVVRVVISGNLVEELRRSLLGMHPEWASEQTTNRLEQATDLLSRTPPVPWIQENEWAICCGDFCRYLGEWDQTQLTLSSPDSNGPAFLWSILVPVHRARRDRAELWEEIGSGWAAIYVFECRTCGKLVAVEQSY